MVKTTVEALKEKKGYDIKVIDISDISILADYFIIANGNNTNQVQAMVDNVEEQMYKAGFNDPKVEGYNNASWILLDYNDIVIHVFDDENHIIGASSRRFDGAYPNIINPRIVWEIKEYYYATTFGSRVADGVYETQLDGYEFKDISQRSGEPITHVFFLNC